MNVTEKSFSGWSQDTEFRCLYGTKMEEKLVYHSLERNAHAVA